MKRTLLMIGMVAVITAGCGNSGAKNNSDQPGESKAVTKAPAMVLTDITAAKDVKTLLAQNWENKDDAQEAALSGGGAAFEMPYRGFSFFADGTVVQNPRDEIRFGKWAVDDAGKLITITYTNGTKAQYNIEKISAKVLLMSGKGDKKSIEYGAYGKTAKNSSDDPFYGSNNQWRVKPAKPETDEAIRQRVLQALALYNKFLEYNIAIGVKTVTFSGIPSIFNWYRGGMSVIPKDKLEAKWVNCFYNEAQAAKAQGMLDDIIDKKYKWDKNEPNWLKQDADGVKQIADTLAAVPLKLITAK